MEELFNEKNLPEEKVDYKVGELPDGRIVIIRNQSSIGQPTLVVLDKYTKQKKKIRYGK